MSVWHQFQYGLKYEFCLKATKTNLTSMYLFSISGLWRDQKPGRRHSSKTLDTTMECSSFIIIVCVPIHVPHFNKLPVVCQQICYMNPKWSTIHLWRNEGTDWRTVNVYLFLQSHDNYKKILIQLNKILTFYFSIYKFQQQPLLFLYNGELFLALILDIQLNAGYE